MPATTLLRQRPALVLQRQPCSSMTRARGVLRVRCDDEDIIPIISGRTKKEFTPKEYEQLRHPQLLGGKTIGEELSLIRSLYEATEEKASTSEKRMSNAHWDGDVYTGGRWNELSLLYLIFLLTPLAGLLFAWLSYGKLWATGEYY